MQKLTAHFKPAGEHRNVSQSRVAVRLNILALKQAEALGASHRATATLVGVLWIGTIGLLISNWAIPFQFDFFYLLGCVALGWVAGAPGALLVTALSGLFLYMAEFPQHAAGRDSIFLINSLIG